MPDYLRPFRAAASTFEQLGHIHQLLHYILNQHESLEVHMSAVQDQLNTIADTINKGVDDLTNEIAAAKSANPDVDLSGIESAVGKLTALDTANTAPAGDSAPSAPASTETPAPAASDTPAAPTEAPTSDASGEVQTPAPTQA